MGREIEEEERSDLTKWAVVSLYLPARYRKSQSPKNRAIENFCDGGWKIETKNDRYQEFSIIRINTMRKEIVK